MPVIRSGPSPAAWRGLRRWQAFLLALGLVTGTLAIAPTARAASIVVTTLNDTVDAGDCNTLTIASLPGPDNLYSLREAICAANNTAGADTITFQPGMFGGIALSSGQLSISSDMTITGPGSWSVGISGDGTSRVFAISQGTVSISGLTISGTNAAGYNGGGIIVTGASVVTLTDDTVRDNIAPTGAGLAIFDSSQVAIINSDILNNSVIVPNLPPGFGGGIYVGDSGTVTVTDSTIRDNHAGNGGAITLKYGGTAALSRAMVDHNTSTGPGGGIAVYPASNLSLINATISGNHADTEGGGAIYTSSGNITISSSTIVNNTSSDLYLGSGGIKGYVEAPVLLKNTIVANNSPGANCSTLISDGGHNLDDDSSCQLSSANGSLPGVNPQLGPFADNGGPTRTHALLPGSPAIDAGDSAACPATDQRGVARPQGLGCDIGAFEREAGTQTISFNPLPDRVLGDAPFAVSATASSGLPVSFAASPGNVCTIAGDTVTLVGAGDCTVTTSQIGDATYTAASPVGRTFAVKLALTVTTQGAGTVSPGSGGYALGTVVSLTPSPQPGQLFTGWVVDGQAKGWATPLTLTMDANHTVQASFVPAPAFGDVTAETPYSAAIAQLAAREIIKGCDQEATPKLLCPEEHTLRAQMAALIARAMAWSGPAASNPFSDRCDPANVQNCVDDELWNAVGQLAGRDVARGYTDAPTCAPAAPPCYAPRDDVLYAQVISFITRAMVAQGYWTQATTDDGTVYPNIPADSGHRLDFVTYVANVGPVPGTTSATAPFPDWDQPSTRAWFAEALWRALDAYFGSDQPGRGGYAP